MSEELLSYSNVAKAIVPIYATTGHAVTATAVNATGFDRALFIIQTGAMNATAVLGMGVTNSATTNGTYTLITSASLTNVTSAGASGVYVIDVPVNGSYPFLKLRGTSSTARSYVSAIALLYRGSSKQGTDGYSQYVRLVG